MKSFEVEFNYMSELSYQSDTKEVFLITGGDLEGLVSEHLNKFVDREDALEKISFSCSSPEHFRGMDPKILRNIKEFSLIGFSENDDFDLTDWVQYMPKLERLNIGSGIKFDFCKIYKLKELKCLSLDYSDVHKNFDHISALKKLGYLGFDVREEGFLFKGDLSVKELKITAKKNSKLSPDFSQFPELERLWLIGFKKDPDLSQNSKLKQIITDGSPKLKNMKPLNDNINVYSIATADIFRERIW